MALIINLSTLHQYSIAETVSQFVSVCQQYSHGCLSRMPLFFQNTYNYAWVMAQYNANYEALIEPYKLGQVSTDVFLENLSTIFYFLSERTREERNNILSTAWNSSISLNDETTKRLEMIIEASKTEPVYLVSNTNELNMSAILKLFQNAFPKECKSDVDVSIKDSQEPVEIMPNIFLCLSYRYSAFKDGHHSTASLLERLGESLDDEVTVVSQFHPDLDKAKDIGIACIEAEIFYATRTFAFGVRS